ncbi:hypothetical protein C7U34_00420 [Campylobacter jejuni]|nr:hypothetical protein [Campylobacter jejuni]EAJ2820559.1 hypothetical protein [Campylobacter jejuni]EAK6602771.1 hypothetical protein [Campylobacter jejuni]EAM0696385.1 hypothetical protein [Campylobacter jejuni]EDJ9592051.1 hypothetical protein [Campylobacter jejuni]
MREDEVLSFKARHGVNTADHSIKTVRVLPFLITVKTDHADASYNKLILEQGELSSVFYLKPKDTHIKNPSNSKSNQRMNFLMSSTFTHYGNASYNQTILQKDAHISMGVENTYDLALNGAPYLIGAIATYGDSTNNSLNIEAGSSVEFFTSLPKKDKNGNNTFDERITHLVGGLAYQGNVKNNKIFIKDANMIIHGPSKAYASSAAAHISAGYIDSGTDKNFQASKNLLDIDGFNLDMYMNHDKQPLAYNSILFADFWGGKTEQGQALDNTINLKDIKNLKKDKNNENIFAQALFNFYAGASNNGEANYNTLNIELKHPLEIANNFLGYNQHSFYGGFATKGANHNTIDIKNYSSNAADNAYLIMAYNEAAYNKIIINDTLFGVASDKREGILSIIAGLSNNAHDNTLIINNLNLDEYKNNNSIFIAPSAITGLSEAKSYNNTLYIGGNLNIFKNTFIDILAGALVYYEDSNSASNAVAPSDISLSKNNRLILNTKVEARIINNFEHYYLIVSNKINTTPLLKSYDTPINISSEGVLALYTLKEQYPYLKNKEILILQSEQGFIDENSNTLNQEELQSFIEKMQKNKEDFKLSSIDRLKKMNLQKLSYEVRISQDGKSIYAKIK